MPIQPVRTRLTSSACSIITLGRAPCLAKLTRANRGAAVRGAASWLYNAEGRLLFRYPCRGRERHTEDLLA